MFKYESVEGIFTGELRPISSWGLGWEVRVSTFQSRKVGPTHEPQRK